MVSQPGSGTRQVLINKPIQPIQQTVRKVFSRFLIPLLEIGEPSSSSIVINSRQLASTSCTAASSAVGSATTAAAATRQFKPKLKLPIISTQLLFVIKLYQRTDSFEGKTAKGKRVKLKSR